ncbi:MAG: hypothetical protein ABI967_02400 [bacterium]
MRKSLVIGFVMILILGFTVKSNPFFYCGYCQYEGKETWKPRNVYPCSFWHYVFTSNSSDITLYLNTPGG